MHQAPPEDEKASFEPMLQRAAPRRMPKRRTNPSPWWRTSSRTTAECTSTPPLHTSRPETHPRPACKCPAHAQPIGLLRPPRPSSRRPAEPWPIPQGPACKSHQHLPSPPCQLRAPSPSMPPPLLSGSLSCGRGLCRSTLQRLSPRLRGPGRRSRGGWDLGLLPWESPSRCSPSGSRSRPPPPQRHGALRTSARHPAAPLPGRCSVPCCG
mmetsp:Transcript_33755/g.110385  ORF Transcript_33755/g.110385 Transcript_33755/m.110385 type:complete len:210 (+) Transcript_33755:728-1357(+)